MFVVMSAGLYFSKPLLCVEDTGASGEVLIVLGGDTGTRSERALELFKQKTAPRILVSGEGDCEEMRIYLAGKGVPSEALELEPKSRSTRQNAEYSIRLLRGRQVKQAVIVTSWFHSRRALNCFRHYAPEVKFVVAPTVVDRPKAHWPSMHEWRWIWQEYLKVAGYWVFYGIAPG
jgi:uncharacterized SAM-binding protein YcdF (DUF218 family)